MGGISSTEFNKGREIVCAHGVYIRDTDKSHLVEFVGAGRVSLPVSQYHKEIEISDTKTMECTVFIPRWVAEKNHISYEEYETEGLADEDKEESVDWEDPLF